MIDALAQNPLNSQQFPIIDGELHTEIMVQNAIANDPMLPQNMNQELGYWWYDDAERQNAMDMKSAALDYETKTRALVMGWEPGVWGYFSKFHANGDESARYTMGEQWSEVDREKHLQEGRKAYEFDMLTPFLNSMLGEQTANRFAWNAAAISPTMSAEQQADVMNHYLTWVAQSGDVRWSQTAYKVFKDYLIRALGVCYVGMDPRNPMTRIMIRHMRPQEFMWDINSTLDEYLTGTRYLERRYRRNRMDLAWEFKEWMPEILQMSPYATDGSLPQDDFFNAISPRVQEPANSLGGWSAYNAYSSGSIIPMTLPVREFYERRYVGKWQVYDGIMDRTYIFDTPQRANQARMNLWDWWTQAGGELLQAANAQSPILSNVNPIQEAVVDQYYFIGARLVRITSQRTERFPYEIMADWYDGTMTSFVDRGKSRQRFANRMISNMDKIAGSLQGHYVLDKHYISMKADDDELQQKMAEAGSGFVVDSGGRQDFDPSRVVHVTPTMQIGSAVTQLYSIVTHSIEQFYGGSTVIGQADYAGQSGVSQNALVARASTTAMPMFEAFRLFAERIGERVVYNAQFLDPATRMVVVDESNTANITSFAQNGIKDFSQLSFRVTITERTVSPSEQSRRYQQLLQMAGQMPDKAQAFLNLILKRYMDVSWEDRQEILQYIQQQDQQEQQNQERQMALEESMQDRKMKVQEGSLMVKASLADLAAKNLPTGSYSIKVPATPEFLSDILTWAGSDTHPSLAAASLAQNALLNQDIRDMAQVHEQENWTPEQKALQAAKAAQIQKSLSQKDEVARSQKGEENTE